MPYDPTLPLPGAAIEAGARHGRVKISGKNPGFDAYNLSFRKSGDVQRKIIAVRKRKFPYYDEAPLGVPKTPEVCEFMATCAIADMENDQTNEIREVVYAGLGDNRRIS